jgi:DNA-directed RNA polymerase specialized sigma subunit
MSRSRTRSCGCAGGASTYNPQGGTEDGTTPKLCGGGCRSMSDPVSNYFQLKEAAKVDRKAKEIQLWRHWKDNGEKPEHLQPLLKLYDPIVVQKTRMWKAKTVPEAAFKAELQTHIIKAFKNYDPNRGAALNTHVESRLHKAKRYNNRYQNLMYIPEGQSGKIGTLNKAKEKLQEELGREPSIEEIAHHTGMAAKRVKTIMDAQQFTVPMGRSAGEESCDYGSGAETTAHQFQDAEIAIAQNILPTLFPGKPDIHQLFHYTFGTDGHPKISSTSVLAKKMGKSLSQISRMKTHMGMVLKSHMGLDDDDEEDNE